MFDRNYNITWVRFELAWTDKHQPNSVQLNPINNQLRSGGEETWFYFDFKSGLKSN